MMCRLALEITSTVQARLAASPDLNIQSISPLAPPTKASVDIDIFTISLRIGSSGFVPVSEARTLLCLPIRQRRCAIFGCAIAKPGKHAHQRQRAIRSQRRTPICKDGRQVDDKSREAGS